MNDDPTDLERELLRHQPTPPSERLLSRLEDAFSSASRTAVRPPAATWWQRLGFSRPAAALGWGLISPAAAAGIAILVASHQWTGDPLPSAPLLSAGSVNGLAATHAEPRTTRAVNVLYQTLDEGVVLNDGQEPVRRVRYRSADRVLWHNPQSGAQWEVSYPREDVLLIPVQAE